MKLPEFIKRNDHLLRGIGSTLGFLFVILLSCNPKTEKSSDYPPPLYPAPITIALNTDSGYTINQVTGDSIKPVRNSKGEIVKTGVPIPANGKLIGSSDLLKPKIIPASWVYFDSVNKNSRPLPEKLTIIPVDESKLRQSIPGNDTSAFILLNEKGDTIPTGVPVPAIGKIVPCVQPQMEEGLPMSLNNSSLYNIRFLDTYHGLKNMQVNYVIEDRKGDLWIASNDGLTCFDGKRLLHFTKKEGLMFNFVLFIMEDRKGNIWIDYGNGARSLYDGQNFTHFSIRNNIYALGNNSIIEDSKGNIWFKDFKTGVSRYDGKYFTHFTAKEGMNMNIYSIHEDSKGNIWFGTDEGACRFNGSSFTYFTNKDGLNSNYVNTILEDKKGRMWFGTDKGIACYDGKNFTQYSVKDGLSQNPVSMMLEDKSGNLWISTFGKGIMRFDGNVFTHITESEGLSGNFIFGISLSKNGNIWIATNKGVSYLDNASIIRLSLSSRNHNTGMYVIKENNQGNLLIGSSEYGLLKYEGGVIKHLINQNKIKSTIELHEDENNNLWIATVGRGLFCFDGNQLKQFTTQNGLPNDNIFGLLQDRKGNLWIGTVSGLVMFDGKNFTHFTEKEGLSNENVSPLVEDRNGNIWLGTIGGGLTMYDGKSFTHYTEKEGQCSNFVRSMMEDDQGNLWIGSFAGVSRFDGKSFIHFTEKQGLGKDVVLSILQDNKNNIWAITPEGPSRIPSAYTGKLQTSTASQPGIINYSEKDGLRSTYHGVTIDKQNRMWIAEGDLFNGDLNILDLNFLNRDESPPSVKLKNVTINENFFDYRNLSKKESVDIRFNDVIPFYNVPQNLNLPHNFSRLTFYFTATSQLTSEHIKYSYKMEGLGNEWSNPSSETKIQYQYLPPGTYVFMVKAMGRSQVWGEAYEYRFTIMTPFWQRWWFYTLCGILVLGIVTFIMRKRTSNILRIQKEKAESERKIVQLEASSQQAILNERLRISSELHDEIGATLSGIAMYSHLSKEQMKSGKTEDVEKSLNIMQHSSGEMVNKLNDIVWLINPEKDSLQKLIERLEEYARDMAAIKNMQVRIEVPENIHEKMLPVETRRNIYLFCKEAINNAVKYSGGSLLELAIKEAAGKLEFSVSDNGKGFDAVMVRRGNGLENMQKRADEIGAKLLLQSKQNEGAKISMQCKIT